MAPCSFAYACSCDLRVHRPEVGTCKRFLDDGLNAIFAERAHERVGRGDLPQPIDRRGLVNDALSDQQREPPALTAEFGELGVGHRTSCLNQFVLLDAGHAAPRSLALAKAMFRDLIQDSVASVGAAGGRSL